MGVIQAPGGVRSPRWARTIRKRSSGTVEASAASAACVISFGNFDTNPSETVGVWHGNHDHKEPDRAGLGKGNRCNALRDHGFRVSSVILCG